MIYLLHISLGPAEDGAERLGAEHVPQRGGGDQPRGLGVVVHVVDRALRVRHAVVHHGIHVHRHAVLRQDLTRKIFFEPIFCFVLMLSSHLEAGR